jgi:hypothetical protein
MLNWMFLYKLYVFCSDMKFKMASTAGLSLTLDPMGKMFQNASYVKTMSCSGSHLGITINIKNTKFVKDLPMIDAQFRFNRCNGFREEYISVFSPYGPSETTNMIKAKLYMNVHWMVLYKLYVFWSDMKFKMAATAGSA